MTIALNTNKQFFEDTADDVLYQSLDDLITSQDRLINDNQLFHSAYQSGLYQNRWKDKQVNIDHLDGRAGLQQLPFIEGNDLISMLKTRKSIDSALLKMPRLWQISRGTSGEDKKWLPVTLNDIGFWFRRIRRLNTLLGLKQEDSGKLVLAINEPKPKASNAVPYLWEQVDYIFGGARLEWIIVAMEMLHRNHWDKFAIQKQPHWLMSSANDALFLAKDMDTGDAEDVKSALPNLESGFFWGSHLDGADNVRSQIQSTYGLAETFSLYLSTECREMYAECKAHNGLHLWMDNVIHEIILENGETIFVDQASPGMEGEYVMTAFYEALPLVRYRTGDRIKVVDTSTCACGITHPRVDFTGRMGE